MAFGIIKAVISFLVVISYMGSRAGERMGHTIKRSSVILNQYHQRCWRGSRYDFPKYIFDLG